MKTSIVAIIASAVISTSAFATSASESFGNYAGVQALKATGDKALMEQTVENWKASELAKIEERFCHSGDSKEIGRCVVLSQDVEQTALSMRRTLGLN